MHSREEDLVGGHMEERKIRSCGDQGASIEKNIRIKGDSWSQQGTPTQWK